MTSTPTARPHIAVRPDWLALHHEAALEPERVIIDPHHHLWERPESFYAPQDLLDEIRECGHNIRATVLVEAGSHYRASGDPLRQPLGEVEHGVFAARYAAECGGPQICAGIVAHADLSAGDAIGAVLDEMIALGQGHVRGVRFGTVSHSDPTARGSMFNHPPFLLADPAVRAGLRALTERGLSFDAWLYHSQLNELLDMARDFPDLPIILNHVGAPLAIGPYTGQMSEVRDAWRKDLATLAACENVHVKVGAFGMRLFGFNYPQAVRPPASIELAADIEPLFDTVVTLFGAERAMFESNFPVDKASFSYGVFWNACKRLTGGCSEAEKHALFAGTAARVYRLTLKD